MSTGTLPPPPADYSTLTAAAQNAYWVSVFTLFPGKVTAAWVASQSALAPYLGMSALAMYKALATKYPAASPQQRGSTVYQTWLGAGTGTAIQDIAVATGGAVGAVSTGIQTASILPGWTNPLTDLLTALTSENTWIRVAETAIGIMLLIGGIMKLSGAGTDLKSLAKVVR